MSAYNQQKIVSLIMSIFKSREDVFAIHWAKGNKSGCMPAYSFNPFLFRQHKMKGGSLKNFKHKKYQPLTGHQFLKHLNGEQLIGIYPLLQDNTSWLISADFDKENWKSESLAFLAICDKNKIPAYLERSRSGNGGHVWIFFDRPYPAIKSRKIVKSLLEQCGVFSRFDKNSSFDRLFPNQDFLSGKGLGNLIALPFHKTAFDVGNSCFVNPLQKDLPPYEDQWTFLSGLKKVSVDHLNSLNQMRSKEEIRCAPVSARTVNNDKLQIVLSNDIRINKNAIPDPLIKFLTDKLNFTNSEFFIKKKSGRSTWLTPKYFKCIEEYKNEVAIPRGFIGKLLRFCISNNIDYEFLDNRSKHFPIDFKVNLNLREHQKNVMEIVSKKDYGVIVAPPGSGKTIIALKIIAEKKQPSLIVVHRKQLMEQWIERIESFLGISKGEIGKIGQGKAKIGKSITVAMIQSLEKFIGKPDTKNILNEFGTIIIDECHHIPAKTFSNVIARFSPYYQYGLTATPFRKGNDEKLIFIHLGEKIAEIKPNEVEHYKRARIIVRNTSLCVPFNRKTDQFETLSKILVHDSERNKLILQDVTSELRKGKKVVLLTERREHIETLNQFIKQSFETITLSGEDSESSRKNKWQQISSGNYQALITTGQFFGEGTDLQNVSCLFLVYPFAFKGKLIQYIGRVQRSEITPIIYDYRDFRIDYLNRLFLKRNTYYRNLDKQASLFDELQSEEHNTKNVFSIHKKIKIPIEQFEFRYGTVAFQYSIQKNNVNIEFEVENDNIRPEFEVLKPYFVKILGKKQVEISIFAEFENNVLVAQSADSDDIEKINREIIESVRFRFIETNFFGKNFSLKSGNLHDLAGLQEKQGESPLFNSEEELLDHILSRKQFRHSGQLRYLATKHENKIMKLRFVLEPFSFVFLLSGDLQYHLILETLDTEEATYIWHLNKNIGQLKQRTREIDEQLNLIKNNGRQFFLKNPPENFNRILHDYTNERKGFVIWRDTLEEQLI